MTFSSSVLKPFDFQEIDKEISKLGSEGWELVNFTFYGMLIYTFKRELK